MLLEPLFIRYPWIIHKYLCLRYNWISWGSNQYVKTLYIDEKWLQRNKQLWCFVYFFHADLIYFISACPVPSTPDVMYGKDGSLSKSYPNLQEAWDRCAIVPGCEFVMRYFDGKYYLRRLSDPNITPKNTRVTTRVVWGYFFKMCSN